MGFPVWHCSSFVSQIFLLDFALAKGAAGNPATDTV